MLCKNKKLSCYYHNNKKTDKCDKVNDKIIEKKEVKDELLPLYNAKKFLLTTKQISYMLYLA